MAHKIPFVDLCIPPITILPDTVKHIYDGGQLFKKRHLKQITRAVITACLTFKVVSLECDTV